MFCYRRAPSGLAGSYHIPYASCGMLSRKIIDISNFAHTNLYAIFMLLPMYNIISSRIQAQRRSISPSMQEWRNS